MGSVRFAVHDLVRVDAEEFLETQDGDAPAWVAASLRRAPWLVVRRESPSAAGVPVGVRGCNRAQRFGARVVATQVRAKFTPESLVLSASRGAGRLGEASRRVADFAAMHGLAWGPTGSFGFELASGVSATTPESDLDIVVRATGVPRTTLLALDRMRAEIVKTLNVSVDVELAVEAGGVALREYAAASARVLAKTPHGPAFVPCP